MNLALIPALLLFATFAFAQPDESALPPSPGDSDEILNPADISGIADGQGLNFLNIWPYGGSSAVAGMGQYLCMGNGGMFQVFDVSDPDSPVLLWEHETPYVRRIVIADSIAYILCPYLLIIDLRVPTAPRVLGSLQTSSPLWLTVDPPFVFITSTISVMTCVDVSNLMAPFPRSSIVHSQFAIPLAARDRRVYVRDSFGLWIVNATNPDSMHDVLWQFAAITSGMIKDTLLYLGGAWSPQFRTYSISNPDQPVLLGGYTHSTPVWSFALGDTVAFLSVDDNTEPDDNTVISVSVANPQAPFPLDTVTSPFFLPTLRMATTASNGRAYGLSTTGILVVDAERSDSLIVENFIRTGGEAQRTAIVGRTAYVAAGFAGLRILDFTDIQTPVSKGNIFTGGFAFDVAVSDTIAFVAFGDQRASDYTPDSLEGVWVVSIANPDLPHIISRFLVPGIGAIAIEDDRLYLARPSSAGDDSSLVVLDVSNPVEPTITAILEHRLETRSLAVRDSFAYIAANDSGLKIVDCRTLASLSINSSILQQARSIHLEYPLAYVDKFDSFYVVDVSNPNLPTLVSAIRRLQVVGSSWSYLAKAGQIVYWSSSPDFGGFDVTRPEAVVDTFRYDLGTSPAGMTSLGDTVLLANGRFGLWLIYHDSPNAVEDDDIQIADDFLLFQNFPNPFNPTTKIQFYVPHKTHIVVEIWNTLGERVRTLVDDDLERGRHTATLNATHFASGIYFCTMKGRGFQRIAKMIHIK